jgi:hypothetical protein
LVEVPGLGDVSITVPRPSLLILDPATQHLRRAEQLRRAATKQISRGKWVQPGFELTFTNEPLVFDFFAEAIAGVLLAHAALDNVLNELLPEDFVFTASDGRTFDRATVERSAGVERRLTEIAAAASGRQDIRDGHPALFEQAMQLKALRDDLGHAKRDRGYAPAGSERTIFTDLFAADLASLAEVPRAVGDYYGWG